MRAVGVNELAAGGTWMWAGARPAPAVGAGCLRWSVHTTPACTISPSLLALAPAQASDVLTRLARAGASTCPSCRCWAGLLFKWIFCSSTVPTDCTITVMQWEIKWLCPDSIPALFSGQTWLFWSIISLLPVFLHYYHHFYSFLHLLLSYNYSLLSLLLHHYYILSPSYCYQLLQ